MQTRAASLVVAALLFTNCSSAVVSTLAGNGTAGDVDGTGGPQGTAEFQAPTGVAVDARGNVYVADSTNNRIRRIAAGGSVTTFAGNDKVPFADGTGGPDGTAAFSEPQAVAVDAQGNVYVGDVFNNCVRKIDPAGDVTTLAGNGGHSSMDGTGGRDGTAMFTWPAGVAVDGRGNVYVADLFDNAIRKIDPAGNVTTFAGNTTAGFVDGPHDTAEFNAPAGVAVDASGNVYVADTNNNRIRKIDPGGDVTTLAGNGLLAIPPSEEGGLGGLLGGQYTGPNGVQQGYADGTGGPHGTAEFRSPAGVAVDSQGNVYVADSVNSRIREIDPAGNVTTLAGNGAPGFADGTGGANGTAKFESPCGVAVDAHDTVYVSDCGSNRVRQITR